MAVLEEQKNNLQNLVGRLRDDVQKLESTVDKLRTDHASVQMQKCTFHADLERLKGQMTPLESTLEKLSSLNSTLAEEHTSLQALLDRYRKQISKFESNADVDILEISSLRERIAVLQNQLTDLALLKEAYASLQSTLSTLKSENAVLYSEKVHLQKNVDRYVLDVSELRRTLEKNRTELSKVQEERGALRVKVERLNEAVKIQIRVADESAEKYQAKLSKQEETSGRLLMKRVEAAEQGLGELAAIMKGFVNIETKLESLAQTTSTDSLSSGRDERDERGEKERREGELVGSVSMHYRLVIRLTISRALE